MSRWSVICECGVKSQSKFGVHARRTENSGSSITSDRMRRVTIGPELAVCSTNVSMLEFAVYTGKISAVITVPRESRPTHLCVDDRRLYEAERDV